MCNLYRIRTARAEVARMFAASDVDGTELEKD
jgi:hypothetical protein